MSCTFITGMFQCFKKLKKYVFASVILFGTNNRSSIYAVWVLWGQELTSPLNPDWQVDYKLYVWWKLDPGRKRHRCWFQSNFAERGPSSMWAKPSIRTRSSIELLLSSPSCLHLSFREIGVIRGNWISKKKNKNHWTKITDIITRENKQWSYRARRKQNIKYQ